MSYGNGGVRKNPGGKSREGGTVKARGVRLGVFILWGHHGCGPGGFV